jgi:hypothetical protein
LGGAAVLATLVTASPSYAQRPSDKAIAEALFRDAKQRLEAGDIDGACPKFQDSQKMDPALGTLLFLAICHERQGRTATAWSEFSSASSWADRTAQPERGDLARKHMAALEARLWKLTIHAVKTPGLELRVDGAQMSAASLDIPLPLDTGDHVIEASAPEYRPWRTTVKVPSEAGAGTVEVPALEPVPSMPPPVAAPVAPPPTGNPEIPTEPPPASSGRTIAAWTSVVVGVAGIATGAVFGFLTLQERDNANKLCHPNTGAPGGHCDPGGHSDIDRAYTYATVSDVAFGVGAAGAIAATYLLLRGPGTSASNGTGNAAHPASVSVAPAIGPTQVGLAVGGRFE